MPPETYPVLITPQEREVILSRINLSPGIVARFRFAVPTRGMLDVALVESDMVEFLTALSEGMFGVEEDSEFAMAVESLTDRNTPDGPLDGEFDLPPEAFPDDMPPQVIEDIRTMVKEGNFKSLDEAAEAVDAYLKSHNTTPIDGFGGLSPAQVYTLLASPWDETNTALAFSTSLTDDDVAQSPMVQNGLLFLAAVAAEEPVRLTARGNLNRDFLHRITRATIWPRCAGEDFFEYTKKPNEEDIMPVHILRILLEDAGFIALKRGKLTLTKKGKAIMAPSRAGTLQVALFTALYHKFNLAYLDRLPDYPDVQETYPFTLYQLGNLASKEPADVEALSAQIFLPFVQENFMKTPVGSHARFAIISRVVFPLSDFGLLALHYHPVPNSNREELHAVQTTPLFEKMIQFDL